jgi:hypothetical protein
MAVKQINFIPSEKEMKILEDHCANLGLSKTAVLRELIRKLGEENAAKAATGSTPRINAGACAPLFGQSRSKI